MNKIIIKKIKNWQHPFDEYAIKMIRSNNKVTYLMMDERGYMFNHPDITTQIESIFQNNNQSLTKVENPYLFNQITISAGLNFEDGFNCKDWEIYEIA